MRTFRPFCLQPPIVFRRWRLACHPRQRPCVRDKPHVRHARLHQSLGSWPRQPAESSLPKLRTGRSPWVALHLVSRRRSDLRIQKLQTSFDADLHRADSRRSKAHECGDSSPLLFSCFGFSCDNRRERGSPRRERNKKNKSGDESPYSKRNRKNKSGDESPHSRRGPSLEHERRAAHRVNEASRAHIMAESFLLALDQGTTSTRAVV